MFQIAFDTNLAQFDEDRDDITARLLQNIAAQVKDGYNSGAIKYADVEIGSWTFID